MKPISLEPVFLPATAGSADIAALRARLKRLRGPQEQFIALADVPFDTAYDLLRVAAAEHTARGEASRIASTLTALLDSSPASSGDILSEEPARIDVHAALLQILTALYLEQDDIDSAVASAAGALSYLAQQPRRKDVPFLQVLGSLLYDIAYLHGLRDEHKQAERAIDKAIKIFERLAKVNPARYASPHVMSLNGATTIYRNRMRQAELLARYQADTSAYIEMLKAGVEDAALRLSESLANEGDTLSRMGKHREAIQYYSRALKFLTRVEPAFSLTQLRLSISLGESMLAVSAMREKGVHLLNTMLHKATKINALDEHRRIVDALYNAKSRSLDILSIWHKVFPK